MWTAEMFLIFGLRRPDVLSLGDAGLRELSGFYSTKMPRLKMSGEAWRHISPWRHGIYGGT
jgi:DNA-3-methyladenine glycosylase II